MTNEAAPAADLKQYAQHIAFEFLKDASYGQGAYEVMYRKHLDKLMSLPAEDLMEVSEVVEQMILAGVSTRSLRTAFDKYLLVEACRVFSGIVLPHLDELSAGDHGIVGALRGLDKVDGIGQFLVPEGKKGTALAVLKMECALDRNQVIGDAADLRMFIAGNPGKADAIVRAIGARKTLDVDVLSAMVDAGVLADGAL